jgi:uncharacterized paraquat-inducible protein A
MQAQRMHIVTDQGNGGAYCSQCDTTLKGDEAICPGCKSELEDGDLYISQGGSDF